MSRFIAIFSEIAHNLVQFLFPHRWDDMVQTMKQVVDLGHELADEERTLLSVAYKNKLGARRSSWKTITKIEKKTQDRRKQILNREYRKNIEREIQSICNDILKLIDKSLIRKASSPESKVFYYKMKGDYYRYLAEIGGGKQRGIVDDGEEAYQKAYEIAKKEMEPTDPMRLGVALNFSVFCCEIRKESRRACHVAKEAFDEASAKLEDLSEDQIKDIRMVMTLLEDNIDWWSSEH